MMGKRFLGIAGVVFFSWSVAQAHDFAYPRLSDYPTPFNQEGLDNDYEVSSDIQSNGLYTLYPMVKVGTYSIGNPGTIFNTYNQYTLEKGGDNASWPTVHFGDAVYPIYCNVPQLMNAQEVYPLIQAKNPQLINARYPALNELPPLILPNTLSVGVTESQANPNEMVRLINTNGWLPNVPGLTDFIAFTPDYGLLTRGPGREYGVVSLGWPYLSGFASKQLLAFQIAPNGIGYENIYAQKHYVTQFQDAFVGLMRGAYDIKDAVQFIGKTGLYAHIGSPSPYPAPSWLNHGVYLRISPYCGFRSNLKRWYTPLRINAILNNTSGLFVRYNGMVEVPIEQNVNSVVNIQVINPSTDDIVASYPVTGQPKTVNIQLPIGQYRLRVMGPQYLSVRGQVYFIEPALQEVNLNHHMTLTVRYQKVSAAPIKVLPLVIQTWRDALNPLTLLNLTSQPMAVVRKDSEGLGGFQLDNVVPPSQAGLMDVYLKEARWDEVSVDNTGKLTSAALPRLWLGFPGESYSQVLSLNSNDPTESQLYMNKSFEVTAQKKNGRLTCTIVAPTESVFALHNIRDQNSGYQISLYVTNVQGEWTKVATQAVIWKPWSVSFNENHWQTVAHATQGVMVPQLLYPLGVQQLQSAYLPGKLTMRAYVLLRLDALSIPVWNSQIYQTVFSSKSPGGYVVSGLGNAVGLVNQLGGVPYNNSVSFSFDNDAASNRCLLVAQPLGGDQILESINTGS